jgi:hypothetical protein
VAFSNASQSGHIDANQQPSLTVVQGTLGTADVGGTAFTMPVAGDPVTGALYAAILGTVSTTGAGTTPVQMVSGTLNVGTVTVAGGTIQAGTFTNLGTNVNVVTGTVNVGTFVMPSGTLNVGTVVNNGGTIQLGTVQMTSGTLTTGTLNALASGTLTGGTLQNLVGGSIAVTNNVQIQGAEASGTASTTKPIQMREQIVVEQSAPFW